MCTCFKRKVKRKKGLNFLLNDSNFICFSPTHSPAFISTTHAPSLSLELEQKILSNVLNINVKEKKSMYLAAQNQRSQYHLTTPFSIYCKAVLNNYYMSICSMYRNQLKQKRSAWSCNKLACSRSVYTENYTGKKVCFFPVFWGWRRTNVLHCMLPYFCVT